MAKDPVCGMMVDEKKAKFKSDFEGKTFYFATLPAKQHSTSLQRSLLKVRLAAQVMLVVAVAEDTKQKKLALA